MGEMVKMSKKIIDYNTVKVGNDIIKYGKENSRFRDEFGCINDLLTGSSYCCGYDPEKDVDTIAIELCELLNTLYNENIELNNLKNLCRDYNLKLEHIYEIVEDSIEQNTKMDKIIAENNQLKSKIKEYEKRSQNTNKRFNSMDNMVIDMEHEIPSILTVSEEQRDEFLNGLNGLCEEISIRKTKLDFLEAHNKALIHTNGEMRKILELEYFEDDKYEYWRGYLDE